MNTKHTVFSTMDPTEASQVFNMEVDALQRNTGLDYTTAFERAKIAHKDLWARVKEGDQVVTTSNPVKVFGTTVVDDKLVLGNEGGTAEPVFGPQMRALLGLPGDSDAQENAAAWNAVKGNTAGPRDSKAIWKMLFALWSGRMADKSPAAVELFMKQRFPVLAQEVL